MGHVIQSQIGKDNPTVWNNQIFTLIYAFHMPLFFFLSGLTFNFYKDKSIIKNIASRAKNLLLPFFSWQIVAGLILGEFYYKDTLSYLYSFIQKPDKGLWFLLVLFEMIVATLIIYKVFSKIKTINLNFVFILFIVILALVLNFANPITEFLGVNLIKNHYLYFVLGVLVFTYKDYFIKKQKFLFRASIATLTGVLIFNSNYFAFATRISKFIPQNIILLLIEDLKALTLIYITLYLLHIIYTKLIITRKYLNYLGTISLDIYVIHWTIIIPFSAVLMSSADVSSVLFATTFLLLVSVGISNLIKFSDSKLSLLLLGK